MFGLEDKVDYEPPDAEPMAAFFDARIGIYDRHMLDDLKLDGFYREIATQIDTEKVDFRLLDLGCGTGIELGYLFERYPQMRVTGIDLSPRMLDALQEKFPDKDIRLIEGSYFDVDLGGPYDYVLSTYSFHHFTPDEKRRLYARIRETLAPDGTFVFGDYTVATIEEETTALGHHRRFHESLRDREDGADDKLYHFDIPLTAQSEVALMREAGFTSVEVVRACASASIIVAR